MKTASRIDFSRPGKPTDNVKNESFNGRFQEKCLSAHGFLSLEDARRQIEAWRWYYNEAFSHWVLVLQRILQWRTPSECARQCGPQDDSVTPKRWKFHLRTALM